MDVLDNLLGIRKQAELNREEERITKLAIITLWENNLLDNYQTGTYEMLAFIHEFIFNDVYEWAGKTRDVNIYKDDFAFVPVIYLETALQEVEKMSQKTLVDIVEKYAEMNVVHPFREGNGRAARIWLDQMLKKELGMCIDWNGIDKQDYFDAMVKSHTNTSGLYLLFSNNLTEQINDRELFFKGIDSSYWYEGLNEYKMLDIQQENDLIEFCGITLNNGSINKNER